MGKKVLVLGDTHFPFHCKTSLTLVFEAIKREKPDCIVQVGDLYDFYSASSFPRSHNILTPKQEAEEGREAAEEMWAYIRKISPKSKCYQLWGNHDVRPKKRVLEAVPHLEHFFGSSLKELFQFKGVRTLLSDKDELLIDGVVYEHGCTKFGNHVKENNASTVTGHLHRGAVHYENTRRGEVLFELNAGYLANPHHECMQYGRKKWNKWTRGYGLIDENGPRFICLEKELKEKKDR